MTLRSVPRVAAFVRDDFFLQGQASKDEEGFLRKALSSSHRKQMCVRYLASFKSLSAIYGDGRINESGGRFLLDPFFYLIVLIFSSS